MLDVSIGLLQQNLRDYEKSRDTITKQHNGLVSSLREAKERLDKLNTQITDMNNALTILKSSQGIVDYAGGRDTPDVN